MHDFLAERVKKELLVAFRHHGRRFLTLSRGRQDRVVSSSAKLSYLGTSGRALWTNESADAPAGLPPLLMSRDGVRWKNTNKRQPFFAPRGPGHWDAHMVTMSSAPIEVGDELWFFYGGSNSRHDWWLMGGFGEEVDHPEARDPSGVEFGLGLATLRKEGFAGLFANRVREGLEALGLPLVQLDIDGNPLPQG